MKDKDLEVTKLPECYGQYIFNYMKCEMCRVKMSCTNEKAANSKALENLFLLRLQKLVDAVNKRVNERGYITEKVMLQGITKYITDELMSKMGFTKKQIIAQYFHNVKII